MNYLDLLKSKGIQLDNNLEAKDQYLIENVRIIGPKTKKIRETSHNESLPQQ